jgi:UDP-glucose 6-dehydrogenase
MTDYYHDKLNWRNELLVITSEEASEIIKVVSKILRYGMQPKDQKALIEEIGDMQCMIDLIVEHKLITKTQIKNRIKVKSKKLKKWSNLWQKKLEK